MVKPVLLIFCATDTVPGDERVRVVPSLKAKRGAVWSLSKFPHEEWKVEMWFRITGRGIMGADGLVSDCQLHKVESYYNSLNTLIKFDKMKTSGIGFHPSILYTVMEFYHQIIYIILRPKQKRIAALNS